MQIIPAIDVIAGKCVRLSEGRLESSKDYGIGAADMAGRFARAGAGCLHLVDIEGAMAGHFTNWPVVEAIGAIEGLHTQVGGGIRTEEDVERLLSAGVHRVVLGSLVIHSPAIVGQWAQRFGPDRFCVAIDLKNGDIAYAGWQRTSRVRLDDIVSGMMGYGITHFLSTDVQRDGMLKGPNVAMYAEHVRAFPNAHWLASGGVDSIESLKELQQTGVDGVVVGKAFFEGILTYEECVRKLC